MYMKRLYEISLCVAALAAAVSCRSFSSSDSGDEIVACVGRAELRAAEVSGAVPSSLSGDDSTAFAGLYVDRWMRRMLKVEEAEMLFSESASDIERQVEEFRQSLLVRKVDQYYIDRSADTTVTEDDMLAYYESHAADFRLDRTLVKGRMVRFPESYRRQQQLYSLMSSPSQDKQRDFDEICTKNDFHMLDSRQTWIDYADFLSELPVTGAMGASLLHTGKVQNLKDAQSVYYVEITDILRAGDQSPYERVRPTIRRILGTARRNDIIRAHEEELIGAAADRRDVRINDRKINETEQSDD